MKVIFLDIDGVLNTSLTIEQIHHEWKETGVRRIEIDLERVEYLKRIVEKTDAKIVLSSSWRHFCTVKDKEVVARYEKMQQLLDIFKIYGLSIYDITPKDPNGIRENEIRTWMEGKEIDSFIVIDDESCDLQSFIPNELIKTSFTKDGEMVENMDDCIGLCEYHIEKAISILNKNDNIKKHK